MTTKIQKWGNSLALRLPKEITEKFDLSEGSQGVLEIEKKQISIKPSPSKKKYSLRDLLVKMTPKNSHDEILWGKTEGKEVW